MGWKIIEIQEKCLLRTFNNNLIIYDLSKKTIPMSDIDVLIIDNNQINISIVTINELISNGVCVITCNEKHLPHAYVSGYKVQKQSHVNFEKQLTWTSEFKQSCWKWIVKQKIQNQIDLLNFYGLSPSDYQEALNEQEDFSSSILEAKVANYYFRQLFKSNFNRNQENIVNHILDYGYTILTNMVARSVVKKGLNLQIAFFHGSIYSSFPLAYDLVEPFRIVIDLFASKLLYVQKIDYHSKFDRDIKSCLLDFIANYKIKIDDKFEFINNAIDKLIDWIINDDLVNHQISFDYQLDIINDYAHESQQQELEEQI